MIWRLIDRPKTLKVTKGLAQRFVDMDPVPHDRPLSERRLQVYQRLFTQGSFRPCTWATVYCKETGGTYRVNGKHTSILLSGYEKVPEFFVTIEEYECDTLEDVAKLYATFDSKMQSRSTTDIYLSFAATMPELAEVAAKVVLLAAPALAYEKYGEDLYGATQPAERAEMLLEHPEFVIWLNEILSKGPVDPQNKIRAYHLRRIATVAAMFTTWKRSKEAATEFWTAVRDETGATPNTPDRKLARYLISTRSRKTDIGKKAGNREFYAKCLHGWNAWRKGEKTDLRYYSNAGLPIAQ